MEYDLILNATNVLDAVWRAHHDRTVTQSPHQNGEKNKISTSLLLHLLREVWMLSGLLTGTALRAAVKLMGSSCPLGDWELCWSLHCACQSAGQLQRGKFKNGFWRIKCNTVKYSTGARDQLTHSSISSKTGDCFIISLFQHHSLCGIVGFYENIDILMILRLEL